MFLEIPSVLIDYLVLAIPVIAICFVILFRPWLEKASDSKWRNYLSYLIRPLPIKSLKSQDAEGTSVSDRRQYLKDQLTVRLVLVYGLLVVFIISSILGVFYYIASDALILGTQGSTGLSTRISSIVIATPFNGGWSGALPWYGSYPTPHYSMDLLHEPWQWIFQTAIFTDNPVFFDTKAGSMILLSLLFSAFFLVPLALKSIRKSFVPSIFFLMTGMLVMMRGIFGFTAIAIGLEFGSAVLITGAITSTGSHPHGIGVLQFGIPVILLMSITFVLLAQELWRVHYAEETFSSKWFVLFILLAYWISFLVLIPY
jgi:hypothetical protein